MPEVCLTVNNVFKTHHVFDKPSDRLKELLGFNVGCKEIAALKPVSFFLERGETVGIVGSNGSGKSVLLQFYLTIKYMKVLQKATTNIVSGLTTLIYKL